MLKNRQPHQEEEEKEVRWEEEEQKEMEWKEEEAQVVEFSGGGGAEKLQCEYFRLDKEVHKFMIFRNADGEQKQQPPKKHNMNVFYDIVNMDGDYSHHYTHASKEITFAICAKCFVRYEHKIGFRIGQKYKKISAYKYICIEGDRTTEEQIPFYEKLLHHNPTETWDCLLDPCTVSKMNKIIDKKYIIQ